MQRARLRELSDREGRLVGAFGSPGGPSILAYNTKALIGVLDWNLPVAEAFARLL